MATIADQQHLTGVKDDYEFGFHDDVEGVFKTEKGLSHDTVDQISDIKEEPAWMRTFRHEALDIFLAKGMPEWGADLSGIDFDDIYYYLRPTENQGRSWDDVPEDIKTTFDRLGIPEAERKFLAGVGAQYDSEVIYHSLQEEWEKHGVVFKDMDSGLREHEDMVREYFATLIPAADNKFAALNSAVWSGGSFVYVPKGVQLDIPLQAYFRINAENMGQFERTLIIVEEGANVHYVEGCTAPVYSSNSLHSAVVEIFVKEKARCRYTTIQNWSTDVYNLVTKRAVAEAGATMEWMDGNLGSKVTMKYPAVYMMGPKAHGEILSIAFAGKGQHQDAGAKVVHAAPDTSSKIISKSISPRMGGAPAIAVSSRWRRATSAQQQQRGVRRPAPGLRKAGPTPTPTSRSKRTMSSMGHEASVSRIGEEQLFYLMSRGIDEDEAAAMIVGGFIEPLVKELPMEYAVEMNRLIQLQMEGSIG